jgi:hypothetical protein
MITVANLRGQDLREQAQAVLGAIPVWDVGERSGRVCRRRQMRHMRMRHAWADDAECHSYRCLDIGHYRDPQGSAAFAQHVDCAGKD